MKPMPPHNDGSDTNRQSHNSRYRNQLWRELDDRVCSRLKTRHKGLRVVGGDATGGSARHKMVDGIARAARPAMGFAVAQVDRTTDSWKKKENVKKLGGLELPFLYGTTEISNAEAELLAGLVCYAYGNIEEECMMMSGDNRTTCKVLVGPKAEARKLRRMTAYPIKLRIERQQEMRKKRLGEERWEQWCWEREKDYEFVDEEIRR